MMDNNGEPSSLMAYSHVVIIPMITLANYIVRKVKVGSIVGTKPIVSEEVTRFLIDVIIRHELSSTPKGVLQILDMLM